VDKMIKGGKFDGSKKNYIGIKEEKMKKEVWE
jgi:hypothetical protein